MRTRILILTLLLIFATPRAAFADDSPSITQRLEQLASTVKQTVVDLWNRWAGDAASAPKRAVASAPSTTQPPPSAQPNQQMQAAAPAPVVAAKSTVAAPASSQPSVSEAIKKAHEELKSQATFDVNGRLHGVE